MKRENVEQRLLKLVHHNWTSEAETQIMAGQALRRSQAWAFGIGPDPDLVSHAFGFGEALMGVGTGIATLGRWTHHSASDKH